MQMFHWTQFLTLFCYIDTFYFFFLRLVNLKNLKPSEVKNQRNTLSVRGRKQSPSLSSDSALVDLHYERYPLTEQPLVPMPETADQFASTLLSDSPVQNRLTVFSCIGLFLDPPSRT